jgi:hypothetical protein
MALTSLNARTGLAAAGFWPRVRWAFRLVATRLAPPGGQMREDTMKSKLLLLAGIAALAFAAPINASAATITIRDFSANEGLTPSFIRAGFTKFDIVAENARAHPQARVRKPDFRRVV